jgi:hypothetical protein
MRRERRKGKGRGALGSLWKKQKKPGAVWLSEAKVCADWKIKILGLEHPKNKLICGQLEVHLGSPLGNLAK